MPSLQLQNLKVELGIHQDNCILKLSINFIIEQICYYICQNTTDIGYWCVYFQISFLTHCSQVTAHCSPRSHDSTPQLGDGPKIEITPPVPTRNERLFVYCHNFALTWRIQLESQAMAKKLSLHLMSPLGTNF